jgi:hypothetical protein
MLPLFLDEDSMDRALVGGLRAQGIDVVTVLEAGRLGLPDDEQLSFATSQGRAIYTSNVGDFARIHAGWLRTGRHHAGLILLSDQRTDVGTQIAALTRLAAELTPEAAADRMEFLRHWY